MFGHLPFEEIEAEDVAEWVDQQIESGTAAKTIRNRHGLLSSIMKHGRLRMRLRPDNPCELTELPESVWATSEARQIRFFQPEEWAVFRSCLDDGPPKSKRPRWVVVIGDVASRLDTALAGRAADEYVFRTPQGHPWRYPDFHSKRWTPAKSKAVKAGLTKKITPHMLRHTTVVWSLAEGVPIQVISEMIGHTSLQMTYDIYGGLINLRDPAMGQAMAKAMLATSNRRRRAP